MGKEMGLRERKKLQTRRAISEAAITLFLERGFDKVPVADVAVAADVSTMTVFNYFPTKEDLVFHRFEDHFDDLAEIIRSRAAGESAVEAVRRNFLDGLSRHDPLTGLNDDPDFLSFQRMVLFTPSLRSRALELAARSVDALAAALAEQTGTEPNDITPHVVAGQLSSTRTELVRQNIRRLTAGERAADLEPHAAACARHAFDLLEHGIGGYCR